jgi:predicted nucleotidyltransferase
MSGTGPDELMKRERATQLVEHLLRNLDHCQDDWPVCLVQEVYVFGSFARGGLEPHDIDLDIELQDSNDERWTSHFIRSMEYGRNPYSIIRQPLVEGKRGYEFTFQFRDRADFDMLLLWRKGDLLDQALNRLHALQPDPAASRAPRDAILPEFEGLDRWIPRPIREALVAAVDDGVLAIRRIELSDGMVKNATALDHIDWRWQPSSPLYRAACAVISDWERRGIDPSKGHLHGRDISRDSDTPYFAGFDWRYHTSIPYCLSYYGGVEWTEVVHPTRTKALHAIRIVPIDTKRFDKLHW